MPHVIEPAAGADRAALAFLVDAYDEEVVADRPRTVLRLHPRLAPVKVAVLPLIGNDTALVEQARGLYQELRRAVPAEYDGRQDEYVELVCGQMLAACAPHSKWIDVFCEEGAFDEQQSRAVLEAGRAAGLGLRVHANQLGEGPGVQLAVEMGAASADHCTYLSDKDIEALAGSETVATFLPATDFSTREQYPDARRAIDAGVSVALATNTNPGSSYTTSMSFCIALAVRDLRMTAEEALRAATLGGARALRRDDIGHLAPGARAAVTILDAPSYTHLIYRPGVPLIAATIAAGEPVWSDRQ